MERLRPRELGPRRHARFNLRNRARSAAYQLLQMFRVPRALHRDGRDRTLDLAEIG